MIFNCKPRCLCIKTMKMVLPEMGAGFMPTSLNKICIHARNAHGTGLGDRPLECHHGVWSHQSNFHFRKALFSLIQFLLALQFYHQSRFHGHYMFLSSVLFPLPMIKMRHHIICKISLHESSFLSIQHNLIRTSLHESSSLFRKHHFSSFYT